MYTLKQIHSALDHLCIINGDKEIALAKILEAEKSIETALEEMNGFTVAGRGAIDCLLGCMIGLEMMIEKGSDE